jgi:hypothetical protein
MNTFITNKKYNSEKIRNHLLNLPKVPRFKVKESNKVTNCILKEIENRQLEFNTNINYLKSKLKPLPDSFIQEMFNLEQNRKY